LYVNYRIIETTKDFLAFCGISLRPVFETNPRMALHVRHKFIMKMEVVNIVYKTDKTVYTNSVST